MSESGFPQLPAGPKLPGQSTSSGVSEPNARIIGVPNDLKDLRQSVQITGEVAGRNRDGSVRIKTERGNVDVQVSDRRLNLRNGDKVEIDIPPGRPPRTARVAAEEAPRENREQDTRLDQQPPRPSGTPVDVRVEGSTPAPRPVQAPPSLEPPTGPAPRPQHVVRLEPLTPQQIAQVVLPQPEDIPATLPQVVENAVKIINLQTQDFILEHIVSLVTPPAAESLALHPLPLTPQTQAETVPPPANPQTQAAPLPVLQSVFFLPPAETQQPPIPAPLAPQIARPENPAVFLQSPAPASHAGAVLPLNVPGLTVAAEPGIPSPAQPAVLQVQSAGVSQPIAGLPAATDTFFVRVTGSDVPPVMLTPPDTGSTATARPGTENLSPKESLKNTAQITAHTPPLLLSQHKAGTVNAVVVGQTPQSLPVIGLATTPGAEPLFFAVHAPAAAVTPGTVVTVTPLNAVGSAAPVQALVSFAPPPPFFLTPEPWPLMDDILQTLQQVAPQAAQAFSNVTPSPASPAQLGPAALFFIAALRGGDLASWLGEKTTEILRRSGRSNLLARLGQEGGTLSRLAAEPVSQDWRALSLPMTWDNQMHKVALYYKHDESGGGEDEKGEKQTRFIFDLNFDQMGPVQLDGLFRGQRLDLIVRTQTGFSEPMRMHMRQLYVNALEQTQIHGELSFQNKPEQWVTIQPEKSGLGLSA